MFNTLTLTDVATRIGEPEINLFTSLAEILEIRRGITAVRHPEFLTAVDQASMILRAQAPLATTVLTGDDNQTGRFTLRTGFPEDPVQVNVWQYNKGFLASDDRFCGDLLIWRGCKLKHGERKRYYCALGIIDAVLTNGGLFMASPCLNHEDIGDYGSFLRRAQSSTKAQRRHPSRAAL